MCITSSLFSCICYPPPKSPSCEGDFGFGRAKKQQRGICCPPLNHTPRGILFGGVGKLPIIHKKACPRDTLFLWGKLYYCQSPTSPSIEISIFSWSGEVLRVMVMVCCIPGRNDILHSSRYATPSMVTSIIGVLRSMN